jgi:hypothetical protein
LGELCYNEVARRGKKITPFFLVNLRNLEHKSHWDSFPRRRLFAIASGDLLVDCRDCGR